MRRMGSGMDNMSLGGGGGDPRQRYGPGGQGAGGSGGPPAPPPKDPRGGYGESNDIRGGYGTQEYSQIGRQDEMMPPRHPYAPPGPGQSMPRSRPNYTKLGEYSQCLHQTTQTNQNLQTSSSTRPLILAPGFNSCCHNWNSNSMLRNNT